jgi:hypothetical protein
VGLPNSFTTEITENTEKNLLKSLCASALRAQSVRGEQIRSPFFSPRPENVHHPCGEHADVSRVLLRLETYYDAIVPWHRTPGRCGMTKDFSEWIIVWACRIASPHTCPPTPLRFGDASQWRAVPGERTENTEKNLLKSLCASAVRAQSVRGEQIRSPFFSPLPDSWCGAFMHLTPSRTSPN